MRDYWGYCGEVADLDLMRFPDTGRFRGIAFITFATARARARPPCICMLQPARDGAVCAKHVRVGKLGPRHVQACVCQRFAHKCERAGECC